MTIKLILMKRFIHLLILSAALLAAGWSEYDDSAILSRLEKLEKDVAGLKSDLARANSDIDALRTLIEVVQQNQLKPGDVVSVTSVKQVEKDGVSGWQISFSDGREPITIWNGKDSSAPVIGVTTIGGVLYWTLDGVPMVDPATGQKLPVSGTDGITPKLKIEDGYWYVSYDGEESWVKLSKATAGSGGVSFRSVEVVDGNVVFTLTDGTVYTIPLISVEKTSAFDENDIFRFCGGTDRMIRISVYTDEIRRIGKLVSDSLTQLADFLKLRARYNGAVVVYDSHHSVESILHLMYYALEKPVGHCFAPPVID